MRVGLSYLSLTRQTRTVSGRGPAHCLGKPAGGSLIGTLDVLDEPTIGLHPRDTATLAGILRDLADIGNTVVVVEHDPAMILAADHIVEMGPWSGEKGGEVVCAASRREFLGNPRPITARYLRGEESISVPSRRRAGNGKILSIAGASQHNLKNLLVKIPLRHVGLRDGRVWIGQEHPGRRDAVSGSRTGIPPHLAADGTVPCH